MRDFYSSATK